MKQVVGVLCSTAFFFPLMMALVYVLKSISYFDSPITFWLTIWLGIIGLGVFIGSLITIFDNLKEE